MTRKEALNVLLAYGHECDTKRFMSMLGTPQRGVASINVGGLGTWILESHEAGRTVLSFAILGHLLDPKSANYSTGLVVGCCAGWYITTYRDHRDYRSFINAVVACVPNLDELVRDAAAGLKPQ
jgi:hypothetical protein